MIIRKLLKVIAYILLVYLLGLLLIKLYFITQKKLYDNDFPTIQGYSYYRIDTNEYLPDYKEGDYVFLKNSDEIKEDDYVFYKLENINGFNKVIEIKSIKNELDNIYKKYYVLNDENKTEISEDEVLGKVAYFDKKVNTTLNILTSPITIFIMIVFVALAPSLTYKRYEQ